MQKVHWHIVAFNELNIHQLYDLLALRAEVFVVEQNCPYQDLDGKDQLSDHVFALDKNQQLIATARILPPNVSYPNKVSIGRVVTSPKHRGTGLGIELMNQCMSYIQSNYPGIEVVISAQSHLEKFYMQFGFNSTGKTYLEDNIPHTQMNFIPNIG